MSSLAELIQIVFRGLQLALFVRIVMSWIPHDPFHPFVQLLNRLTDFILIPCRELLDRFIPAGSIGIDFSPIVAFFLLDITKAVLIKLVVAMSGV